MTRLDVDFVKYALGLKILEIYMYGRQQMFRVYVWDNTNENMSSENIKNVY